MTLTDQQKNITLLTDDIINICVKLFEHLTNYIESTKIILQEDYKILIDTKLQKESIDVYINNLRELVKNKINLPINSLDEWILFTTSIFKHIINIYNCYFNLNNITTYIQDMDLITLNVQSFSETKIAEMNILKESTYKNAKKQLMLINSKTENIYNSYIKSLNSYVHSNKIWFNNKLFYQYLNNQLEFNKEIIDLYILIIKLLIHKVNDDIKNYILKSVDIMKDKYMVAHFDDDVIFDSQSIKILNNILQLFNITPLEDSEDSLYKICINLFNIKNSLLSSIEQAHTKDIKINEIISELTNVINIYSKSKHLKYGIMIMFKKNDNIYYNITKLLSKQSFESFNRYSGINREYIDLYDILKKNIIYESIFDNDMCININISKDTQRSFIFYTNDMITYKIYSNSKYKDYSIDYSLIRNIQRNYPSKRISHYNNELEKNIISKVDSSLERKYNDFIELDYSNQLDTARLYKKLLEVFRENLRNVVSTINKAENTSISTKLTNIMRDDKFYLMFDEIIFNFYKDYIMSDKIKNNTQILGEVYTAGLSLADNVKKKIKKELLRYIKNNEVNDMQNFLEETMVFIISNVIKSDLSIYDKLIEKEYKLIELKNVA